MQSPSDNGGVRSNIINIVKTPLGFFVLVVLVVEVLLGVTAVSLGAGSESSFLIRAMVYLIFLLVVIVALLAVFRPASLYGLSVRSTKKSPQAVYQQLLRTMPAEVEKMTQFLNDMCDERLATMRKHHNLEINGYERQIDTLKKEVKTVKKLHKSELKGYKRQIGNLETQLEIAEDWLQIYSPGAREPEDA